MLNNPELNHNGFLYLHDGNHNEIGNPHSQYVSSVYSHPVGSAVANNTNNWIKICSLSISKNTTDDWGYVKVGIINADTNSVTSQMAEIFLKIKYYSGTSIMGELQVKNMKPSYASAVVSVNDSSHYTVDMYVQNIINYGAFRVTELLKYQTRNTTLTYWDGNTNWLASLPGGTVYSASNPTSQTFSSTAASNVDNNSIFMDSADNALKTKDQYGTVRVINDVSSVILQVSTASSTLNVAGLNKQRCFIELDVSGFSVNSITNAYYNQLVTIIDTVGGNVIQNVTGIVLKGGTNATMPQYGTITLVYNGNISKWLEVSRSF